MLARILHFAAAADILGVSPPTLSRLITRIEDVVGAKLLKRTTRSVELTAAGKSFLESSQRILREVDGAAQRAAQIADGKAGHLRMGYGAAGANTILAPLVNQFRAGNPDISIEPILLKTEQQLADLARGDLDLGLLSDIPLYEDVTCIKLLSKRKKLILPKNHPLAGKRGLKTADILDQPFVLGRPQGWQDFYRPLFDSFARIGCSPNIVQQAEDIEAIAAFVVTGLGLSLFVEGQPGMQREGLVYRDIEDIEDKARIYIAWRKGNPDPVLARFTDFIIKHYPEDPHTE